MPGSGLLNNVALLDELVGLLEVNDRRVSLTTVGQEIFRLRNPRNTSFQQVLKQLVKDDARFLISQDGFIELLPDDRERARLDQAEFVVVDVETTGMNPHWDRITEVAAFSIKTEAGTNGHSATRAIREEFSALVNPQRDIPVWITRFTGITNQMVAHSPSFAQIADQLIDFIDSAIIVAHNARFDINFINSEINRVYDMRLFNPRLCTLQLSRKLFPELPNHKLHTLAEHLGVDIRGRHRARGDALATAEILLRMLDLLEDRGIATLLEVQEFRRGQSGRRGGQSRQKP